MANFKIKVTQVFRVEKWIVVDVEAKNEDEALDIFESGDSPCSSLGWDDYWSLENEEVSLVGDSE